MSLIRLPGLIDIHTHLRDPGATHKEDFLTGSRAAVTGGFTFILDMPNNPLPTISLARLKEKILLSQRKAICQIGFHYGTNGKNLRSFKAAYQHPQIYGLKLYLNHTTGEMLIENLNLLEKIFLAWRSTKPILVHAQEDKLALALALAHIYQRRLHVCHVSRDSEIQLIRQAKKRRLPITAGACPHHLFLTHQDSRNLANLALMLPPLGNKKDQTSLWRGLKDGTLDLVESDHAPHTLSEKKSANPPFGVPGLETTLGLLFLAIKRRQIKLDQLVALLYYNPKRIFHLPIQPKTYIEIDPHQSWTVGKNGYQTKCGWSPFAGWTLPAKVN